MQLSRTAEAKWPRPAVAAVAALSIIVLLFLTAVASRKPLSGIGQTAQPLGSRSAPQQIPTWSFVLVAVGATIALAGMLASGGVKIPRRRKEEQGRMIRIPWLARVLALLLAVLLGAVLVVTAIEATHVRQPPSRGAPPPRLRRPSRLGHSSSFVAPGWFVPVLLAVVSGGSGAILLLVALGGRKGDARAAEPVLAQTAALHDALEASLEELRSEPDPRRAVIAAYRRMEGTLGAVGLPRQPWEAPREYSGRAGTSLELSPRPVQTLTALFERARFGRSRIEEPLREQAIGALLALRQELQP